MIQYSACHEKLLKTVRLLVVMDLPIRERIAFACPDQLNYIRPESMPPHLKDDLIKINNALHAQGTCINDSLAAMSDLEVKNLADDIFSLHGRLAYHYDSGGKM